MIQNTFPIFRTDKQYKQADGFEENLEERLIVIDFPPEVQRRLSLKIPQLNLNRKRTLYQWLAFYRKSLRWHTIVMSE